VTHDGRLNEPESGFRPEEEYQGTKIIPAAKNNIFKNDLRPLSPAEVFVAPRLTGIPPWLREW
jgi:hypothetical protein